MNREQIINTIRNLAKSQGFYGRLYEALCSSEEDYEEIMFMLERQNFKDDIDLIMFFETGDPYC